MLKEQFLTIKATISLALQDWNYELQVIEDEKNIWCILTIDWVDLYFSYDKTFWLRVDELYFDKEVLTDNLWYLWTNYKN